MAKKMTPNVSLIKQAVLVKMANQRQATSSTKTRGEVAGGGRKPWKQKGTGRARAGTIRSPLWVGGGKVFGPDKERNYKSRLPKKMQQAAFREILNLHNINGLIRHVKSLELKEMKTKAAVALLKNHGLENKNVVLVTETVQPELIVATNNLQKVEVVASKNLSILHLTSDRVILMEDAVYENLFPASKTASKAKSAVKKEAPKKSAK